jgi:hypothetical protein
MELVRQLDALNAYRFRRDAGLKAAWRSARDVLGRVGGVAPKPAEENGGGTVPPQGGVAPAA